MFIFFITAGSDPYVIARTDPPELLQREVKSSTVIHNLNPVWLDRLTIKLNTNDLYGLRENAHFCLSVWDWDR